MRKEFFLIILFAVLFASTFVFAETLSISNNSNYSNASNFILNVSKNESGKLSNTTVFVGIYILNLGKFDISTGSFTADFYLSMKCQSVCPAQDFEFMNGRASSFEKITDLPNEKFYRIQAQLVSPIDLKRFPFDEQKMQIILEDKRKPVGELNYKPFYEETGIDPSIAFTGWDIENLSITIGEHYYEVYDETYSQYILTIPVERIAFNSFIKTFLPIMFIILVMLSSFVLDPDKITIRLSMVGSALIASVMFHVSLSNQIPPVGYLTFADRFMILTYFVILISFALNVIMLEMVERKNEALVKRMHSRTEYTMFIAVPLVYLALFIFFI